MIEKRNFFNVQKEPHPNDIYEVFEDLVWPRKYHR